MPSLWYLPPAYYYIGRAQQGLGSQGAVESYRKFVSMRDKTSPNPLLADALRRIAAY